MAKIKKTVNEVLPKNDQADFAKEVSDENLPIIKKPSGDVPSDVPFDDGLGEVSQEDLIIPRLKIGQAQSDGDVAGKLFIDITGDVIDEMELVLLKLTKGRVLFPEDFSRDSEPLCKSQNFKTPEESVESPMSTECKECPYAKWTKSSTRKNKPPRCNEVWNLLVLDYENYVPCWLSLKSTALKPARKIISMLKLRGTAKRIPCWGFKFTITINIRTGDSGNSYVPAFSALTELGSDDMESMELIHAQLASEQVNFDEEAETPQNQGMQKDDF